MRTRFTRTVVADRSDVSRQCKKKHPYPSFESALHGCHNVVKKEAKKGTPKVFTIYICPHCSSFHVGKVPV